MRLLILLCFSVLANAAAITSAQTGAWDNTSTWVGGVVPGNGDTVVLANGHVVTINSGTTVTVGSSPADDTGTNAIACSSGTGTGALIVSGTLVFRGPVMQCNASWTVNPGATLTHDSSLAATPATANYKWRFTGAATQTGAYLNIIGTQGSRISVNIASGSGNFGGFAPYQDSGTDGNLTIKYADISNCGTAAGSCIQIYPFTCSTSVVRGLIMNNFTVTDSSNINVTNSLGSCTVELDTGVIKGGINTSGLAFKIGSTAITTAIATNGRRRFRNLFVEGGTMHFGSNTNVDQNMGFEFYNLYLRGGTGAGVNPLVAVGNITTGTSGSYDLGWQESRRQSASGDGMNTPAGNLSRIIAVRNWDNNPHFVVPVARETTIDGWIEWNNANDPTSGGDGWMVQGTAMSNYGIALRNGVMLPQPNGTAFGLAISHNGAACTGANCPQITFDKNTFLTTSTSTGQLGVSFETGNSYAGVYDSVRNNLVYRPTNGDGWLVKWGQSLLNVVDNVFEVADYNWTHNITTTRATKYYSEGGAYAEYVGNAPGAHDSSGDPLFVDTSRTPISYGARWDSGVTTLDTLAAKYEACYRYRANGTTSCDPRFLDLADMYNWVRAGWRARNPATWTAAHDGTHVGGVAPMRTFGVLAQ